MEIIVAILVWFLNGLLPWSMLVSLALWWGRSSVTFRPIRLLLLVLLGIIEDIAMVHYLGITSGLMISLMTVSWLISRYYQNKQLWWWYLLGLSGELLTMVIHKTSFSVSTLLMQLVFLGALQWWSTRFEKRDVIYVKT